MTIAKNDILLGHNLQIVIYWGKLTFGGGNKNLVGESTEGGFFQVGGMSKFLTGRGTPLIPPPIAKTWLLVVLVIMHTFVYSISLKNAFHSYCSFFIILTFALVTD